MNHAMALWRRHEPHDPRIGALVYFSLIAATGFAVGWVVQALGG